MLEYRIPINDLEDILTGAETEWEQLRNSSILLTGGTGYIGTWLLEGICFVNEIQQLNIKICVISRSPEKFINKYPHIGNKKFISFIKGDIRNFKINSTHFTHLIHAATDVVLSNSPAEVFDVTVNGTKYVLDMAVQLNIKRVLLVSSGAVYGPIPDTLIKIPENFPCSQNVAKVTSAYGLGKMATEWLGSAYAEQHKLECTSARIFAQVGPYLELDIQFAVGNFIQDCLMNRDITIKGDGKSLRTYMYGTDLVKWLITILVKGKSRDSYNVGSDQPISIFDLAQHILKISRTNKSKINVLGKSTPGAAPDRYIPDITKAEVELGLKIQVPFHNAIEKTIQWYRPKFKEYSNE